MPGKLYFRPITIKGYSGFGCVLLKLIESTRSKSIGANKTSLPVFPLVIVGKLQKVKKVEKMALANDNLFIF